MNSTVCVCCGESFPARDDNLAADPNLCPSCLNLSGGMMLDELVQAAVLKIAADQERGQSPAFSENRKVLTSENS